MTTAAILINLALSIVVTAFVGGTAFLVASRLDRGIAPYARLSPGRAAAQRHEVDREEQQAA